MADTSRISCEARLWDLHDAWNRRGRPPQTPAGWNRARWLRSFPDHAGLFRSLPDQVGRRDVREVFGKKWTQRQAERAFVAAMVWGYGPNNLGPHRTTRILSASSAVECLHRAARITRAEGPLAGFTAMSDSGDCRVDRLGPAFGTKFLFFASTDDAPAPVLDALVAEWIDRWSDQRIRFGKLSWTPAVYARYLRLVGGWSATLGESVADTEFLIFADAASSRPGKSNVTWAEDWVPADR